MAKYKAGKLPKKETATVVDPSEVVEVVKQTPRAVKSGAVGRSVPKRQESTGGYTPGFSGIKMKQKQRQKGNFLRAGINQREKETSEARRQSVEFTPKTQTTAEQTMDLLLSPTQKKQQDWALQEEPRQKLQAEKKQVFPSVRLGTERQGTDQFLPQPTTQERIDSLLKAINPVEPLFTAGDSLVNMIGSSARERLARQQEAENRKKELEAQMQQAKASGDTKKYLELMQEYNEASMQAVNNRELLDLMLSGWGNDSENDPSRNMREEKARAQENLMKGLTPGEKAAMGITVQGLNMLGSALMAGVTGIPLSVYNAVTQGGATGQEALDQGVSGEKALPLALGSGGISYGVENIGGVAGDWGKRLLNKAAETSTGKALLSNVPQKVVDFLGTLSKNKVAQVVGTGLEEGFENLTEYDLQRMWQNLILDEDTPYDIRQAMSEAASGVLFGSIMAAGNAAGDTLRTKTGDFLEGRQWRQGEWGTLLENAARSSDPSVRQDAADILSGLARGKSPSSEELGSLARRVRTAGTDADVPLFEGVEPKKTAAERLADQLAAGAMKKSPRTEQGPVIREGMTDTERFQALRDTQISVPEAKPERLEGVDLGELETAIKSQARQYIRPLAEKLGVFKNYQNDNVDLEFSYTKGGFDESIHKQKDRGGRYDDFAKMFSVFDELVQNAVPVEFHGDKYAGTKRADADLNRVAVLVSAFQDGDRIVPVQFEIKEKNKYTNKLYVSVTLQDIKTEPGVVGGAGQLLDPVTPPTRVLNYSISQLLEGVNPEDTDFLKYVPDGFLSWSQQAGKQRGILAEQEKLRKLRQESPVDTILNAGQGPAAENPAVDAILGIQKNRSLANRLADQLILNNDESTRTKPAEEAETKRRLQVLEEAEQAMNPGPQDPGEGKSSRLSDTETAEVETLLNGLEEPVGDFALTKEARQAQNQFYNALRKEMPLPADKEGRAAVKKALEGIVREISDTGTLSRETADQAFDTLYDSLRILNTDRYDQYKGVKKELRESRLYLSDADRSNIPDFESFRKSNMGNFTVTKDPSAVSVDQKYQELSRSYPELFPDDITHPADQIQRMSEVSKSINKQEVDVETYYGDEEPAFREYVRDQFDAALGTLAEKLENRRNKYDPGTVPPEEAASQNGKDYAENEEFLGRVDRGLEDDPSLEDRLREAYREAAKYQAEAHRYDDLSKEEQEWVDILKTGKVTAEQAAEALGDEDSFERVMGTVEGQQKFEEAMKPIREYQAQRLENLKKNAQLATANIDMWQDKKTGFQYQRETMERNLRDIIPNKYEAERIIDYYFTPVHEHEAERKRFLKNYRNQVEQLDLSRDESRWVQMVGEGVKDIKDVPAGMDPVKIARAVRTFKNKIYPELYDAVSDTLVRNGYAPPGRIQDYFPHFSDPDDPLTSMLRAVGIDVNLKELPTSIAGKTETFEPGKRWFGNLLHREGKKTSYDALEGFERYIDSASQLIYHTEDIQKLRMLENVIRDRYDTSGSKKQLDTLTRENIENDLYKDWDTDKLFGKDMSRLSHFITELRSYTNSLAGKKSIADRNLEHTAGRGIYSISKALEGRVASNMVALNPGTWATNLIPLTQGGAEISNRNLVKALNQTMKNYFTDDGFADRSTFLTNRESGRSVSRSKLQKVTDAMSSPMEAVDLFTANVLTRGRYLDNLNAGMSESKAMREADKWAAGLMGDRSLGATPTIFEQKNPFAKLFTMFQLETNNQLSHLFKDLPQDAKQKGVKWTAKTILEMTIGSWIYNEIYEKLTGRRPAVDPIGIATDFAEDLKDENLSTSEAVGNLGDNLLENVPFTSALNLVGIDVGGRYPVQAALPDFTKIGDAAAGWVNGTTAPNAAMERIGKELAKPGFYLLPPAGGGAAKKYVEGMDAVLNGGVYSTNKKGGQELLYPVDNKNPLEILQAVTFGRSATPGGQQYYRNFQPVGPESQEQKNEAKMRSLPRLIDYSYGEDEDRVSGSVILSGKEQKAYQEKFLELLPDNMEDLSEEDQKAIYQYAEQTARDSVLADRGIKEYEPASWVQKAKEAVREGVSIEDYLKIRDEFKEIEPEKDENGKATETAANQKREYLRKDKNLTAEQKRAIDLLLISGGDESKVSDYSNDNAYRRSQMDQTDQARYDAAAELYGIDARRYETLARLAKEKKSGEETSLEKKQQVLRSLMERGMSRREAYGFYAVANASNPGETDWSSNEAACYAGLSDSGKTKYQAVSEYFTSLPPSDFAYIQDVLSSVSGTRNASGKTVTGSKKKNQIAVLMELGMSQEEATIYYNLTN